MADPTNSPSPASGSGSGSGSGQLSAGAGVAGKPKEIERWSLSGHEQMSRTIEAQHWNLDAHKQTNRNMGDVAGFDGSVPLTPASAAPDLTSSRRILRHQNDDKTMTSALDAAIDPVTGLPISDPHTPSIQIRHDPVTPEIPAWVNPVSVVATALSTDQHTPAGNTALGTDTGVGRVVTYILRDSQGVVANTITTDHGSATIDPASGNYVFTPSGVDNSVVHIAVGQVLADRFTVVAINDLGVSNSTVVDVQIIGTNDAPLVLTAPALATDQHASISATATGSDVNAGDTVGFVLVGGIAGAINGFGHPTETLTTAKGAVELDTVTGVYIFTPGAAVSRIAVGAVDTDTFDALAVDSHGMTSAAPMTVTVTITGTNDAPAAHPDALATDQLTMVAGNAHGSDPNAGDTVAYSLDPANGAIVQSVDGSGATIQTQSTASGSVSLNVATGDYTWTPGAGVAHQDVGQVSADSFRVVTTDNHGAITNTDVPVTITGIDVAPVISAAPNIKTNEAGLLPFHDIFLSTTSPIGSNNNDLSISIGGAPATT